MPGNRKQFLKQVGSGLLLSGMPGLAMAEIETGSLPDSRDFAGEGAPDDEKFWGRIARKYYQVAGDYTNLENGYYGIQPKPVLQAFQKNIGLANMEGAKFARKDFPALAAGIKKELAAFLGVSDEEIILTRNATEALNIAIQGYPFRRDDEVLISQLDYFSMIETFRMLEKRGAIRVRAIELPLASATEEEIVELYRREISGKTRVILLTQVSNINGLIVPVSRITAMARQQGIDTITDSAHALGHIPFSLPGLGSDFVGMNLHKWIGNPIGAGILYVRKERIEEMSALYGDVQHAGTSIAKLAHFGTTPFAVTMTIPDSLAFHRLLGVERVAKRLHYLKSIWLHALKPMPGIEVVTPSEKELSCAIASFRARNKKTSEVVNYLFNSHKILTVGRDLGKEGCIRVTPSVYNTADDIRKFIAALGEFTGK